MLKKKLVIALLLFAVYGKSQSLIRSTDNITPDITLNKIIFNESRVKGNKYLYHNWTVGNLITKNNVLSEKKEMIYDLQSDNILVINNSVKNEERNQGIIVETNDILGFVLYDLEGKPHRFVWGGGNLRYVETLAFNDVLVKDYVLNVKQNTQPNDGISPSSNYDTEYLIKEEYYFKTKSGNYEKIKLKKSAIEKAFKVEFNVSKLLKENNLKFKDYKDLVLVINQYYKN